jgi:MFS family permease
MANTGLSIVAIGGAEAQIEADRTISKITRRLVPFLVTCFFAAYLDRVNIGFAALTMNKELGFSPQTFGWGAGVFFIGYCLFEAPANFILHRVGARRRIGNYPPPILRRRFRAFQAKVLMMVWKGFAPLSLAVSIVVRASASACAAHMAR